MKFAPVKYIFTIKSNNSVAELSIYLHNEFILRFAKNYGL